VAAFNRGDRAGAQLALDEAVAAGEIPAQGYILLGELAKGRGETAKAGEWYAKAAETGKGKVRCTALRCFVYSLTKVWAEAGIAKGDAAATALEKEYAEDGDARVARATWYNRRGFELAKSGKNADAVPMFEKSIAARGDFPVFGNNLACTLCDLADVAKVTGEKATLAQKALDVLSKYKAEGKLAETKARAEKILARAK
jgi:tetratricopeptide (TPR) repeat protein